MLLSFAAASFCSYSYLCFIIDIFILSITHRPYYCCCCWYYQRHYSSYSYSFSNSLSRFYNCFIIIISPIIIMIIVILLLLLWLWFPQQIFITVIIICICICLCISACEKIHIWEVCKIMYIMQNITINTKDNIMHISVIWYRPLGYN